MVDHPPHHLADLLVDALLVRRDRLRVHEHVLQALAARGSGERRQAPVVERPVRERDETLVLAAVVPLQHRLRQEGAEAVEDRFEPGQRRDVRRLALALLFLRRRGQEERRRRQLAVVTGDHDAPAAHQGRDGVRGGDLARFVEHDDVEPGAVARQDLADHEGAHRPAGLHREQDVRGLPEELAQRQVPALAVCLRLQDRGFVRVRVPRANGVLRVDPNQPRRIHLQVTPVRGPEARDGGGVGLGVEGGKQGIAELDFVDDGPEPGVLRPRERVGVREAGGPGLVDERAEPGGPKLHVQPAQVRQLAHDVGVAEEVGEALLQHGPLGRREVRLTGGRDDARQGRIERL